MFHSVQYEIVEICKITRAKCTWRQAYLDDDANTGESIGIVFIENVLTEKLKHSV